LDFCPKLFSGQLVCSNCLLFINRFGAILPYLLIYLKRNLKPVLVIAIRYRDPKTGMAANHIPWSRDVRVYTCTR